MGKDDICLETNTNCYLTLEDVRHVSDMHLNLISIGLLDEEGYTSVFGDKKWKPTKSYFVISRGKKVSNFYVIETKVNNWYVNALGEDSSTELRYKRIGHMSDKGLQILAKIGILAGMKGLKMSHKTCTHCLDGKQHRASSQYKTPHIRPHVLDLVHYDVWGAITTSTLGGARCFITFINDHSRRFWVYALKTKDKCL